MNAVTSIYCPIETMKQFNQLAKEENMTKGKTLEKLIESYKEKKEKEKSSKK